MLKLVCEVCGASEILKQDSVFVCQSCGCKYSLSEVKSLLKEDGSEAVSAGSGVANQTSENARKVQSLRTLARRAKEQNDSKGAADYYQQLLVEVPNDWEANFYAVFYASHNVVIGQIGEAASRVAATFGDVLRLLGENVPDAEAQSAARQEILDHVFDFETFLIDNAFGHLGSSNDTVAKNLWNWVVPALAMVVALGDQLKDVSEDFARAESAYKRAAEDARTIDKGNRMNMNLDDLQKDLQNPRRYSYVATPTDNFRTIAVTAEAKQKGAAAAREHLEKLERQERTEKYWTEHAEEKVALEAKKEELEQEIDRLSREISSIEKEAEGVPGIRERDGILKRRDDLAVQRARLGAFKLKEKKALDKEIDELEQQVFKLNKTIKEQKDEILKRTEPLDRRKKEAEKKRSEVLFELTKDR